MSKTTNQAQAPTTDQFDQYLDDFEEILTLLENPTDLSLSIKDLQLLKEIQTNLNNLPEMDMLNFKKPNKKIQRKKNLRNRLRSSSSKHISISSRQNQRSQKLKISLPSLNENLAFEEIEQRRPILSGYVKETIIQSIEYFVGISLEKVVHYERLRIATINSQITIKTADHFVELFGRILMNASQCFLMQRDRKDRGLVEVYGRYQKEKVSFFGCYGIF